MTEEQKKKERARLEASIERRTALLASHVQSGDRIAAFSDLSQKIETNFVLAREFKALQEEKRELEALNGIVEIRVTEENYGTILCEVCKRSVEIGLSGPYCMDHVPIAMNDEEEEQIRKHPMYRVGQYISNPDEWPTEDDYDDWMLEDEGKTKAFRRTILQVLVNLGGRGEINTVLERVEKSLRAQGVISDDDDDLVRSEQYEKWSARARFVRQDLVNDGLLSDAEHGFWIITEEGRDALASRSY